MNGNTDGARRSKPLSLLAVAELLDVETSEGCLEDLLLSHLREHPEFAEPYDELEGLRARFCHPHRRMLAEELIGLDSYLQLVLSHPGGAEAALSARADEVPRSWTLCMRLFECSIDIAPADPARARQLARAALHMAQSLHPSHYRPTYRRLLEAAAWAHIGNSYRIEGDLRTAARCFEQGGCLPWGVEPAIPELWAEAAALEGYLRRDQRDLDEARRLFEAALASAAGGRRPAIAVWAVMALASLDFEAGEHERAVDKAHQALSLIDPEANPRWFVEAASNLASYLTRSGNPQAALQLLARLKPRIERFGSPGDICRASWSKANALRALGQIENAIERYDEARCGFLELQRGFDAALTTLELALVYLEQGRTTEVKRLAAEILPIFEMQGIDREARATLELFRQAAIAEQVTLLQVKAWLSRLGVEG